MPYLFASASSIITSRNREINRRRPGILKKRQASAAVQAGLRIYRADRKKMLQEIPSIQPLKYCRRIHAA